MEGFGAVSAATVMLAALMALVGLVLVPLVERRGGPATPVSAMVGLGTAATMVILVACWVLGLDVAVASFTVLGLAAVGAGVIITTVVRRSGIGGLRVRERQLGTMAIALAIALLALFPLATWGLASWTAFINDFHRYALSAVAWVANSGPGPDFLERFTGAYGAGAELRSSVEKPGSTAVLVFASTITTISPAQLLTPITALVTALATASSAALLRVWMRVRPLPALAIAIVAVFTPTNWGRVMDAQIGQVLGLALLLSALSLLARGIRRPSNRGFRVAVAAGLLVAGATMANATVTLSALPLIGAIAAVIVLSAARSARAVLVLGATTVGVASVLVTPAVSGLLRSIVNQTSGLAEVPPLPLAHPIGLLGIEATDGSIVAAISWAALFVVMVVVGLQAERRTLVLLPVGAAAASGLFLGVVYGVDGYEMGKWLGVAIPLVAALGLGWLVSRTPGGTVDPRTPPPGPAVAPRSGAERMLPTGLALVLAISAVASSTAGSAAVDRVVGASEFAAAADPAIAALPAVTVDTGDYYRNSILPARIEADRIAVAGATYEIGDPPIGAELFTTAARAAERRWTVVQQLPGAYVWARIPEAEFPQLWEGGAISPHLVGDWLAPEPSAVWSAGPGPAWLVFPLTGPLPPDGAMIRLQLLVPATDDAPRALTVHIGTRTLAFPASPQTVRTLDVPLSGDDIIDQRIVVGIDVDEAAPLSVLAPTDPRTLEVGLTGVTLTAGSSSAGIVPAR